jgi:Ca2+-binding EF-hand superfamily protein
VKAVSPAVEFEFGFRDCFDTFLNIMKKNLLLIFLFGCFVVGQLDALAQRRDSKVPWPLLYPNPEQPGKTPLADMRKKMLARFDKDQDGFLNKNERETMRLATKMDAQERSRRIAELRNSERRKEVEKEGPPKRWLDLYDKNKNNRFDGNEWETARSAEIKRVTARYDANKNGTLDDAEKKRITGNLGRNNYNPYDAYIRRSISGLEDKKPEGQQSRWKRFDSDGDKKASRDELKAIREKEAATR